jgi:transposase
MNVNLHHTLKELKTFYRSATNARLARRIHGVYLASKGLTCPQIMEITGSGRRTIQQWVAKYNAGGIGALNDSSRPGRSTKLSRQQEQAFCRWIEAGPKGRGGVSVLNGHAIKKILEQEFGGKLFSVGDISFITSPGLFTPLETMSLTGFMSLSPAPA